MSIYTHMTAHVSSDERYRYVLTREWSAEPVRTFAVIGLNPSTADATKDDPTIRRCVGFARAWGADRLVMVNLFAYRATSPRDMMAELNPVGDWNDDWLWRTSEQADIVIAAWGVHGVHRSRAAAVVSMLGPLHCLGVTKDGHPRHPLYLPKTAVPVPYKRDPQ